jgi:hypothetical protein
VSAIIPPSSTVLYDCDLTGVSDNYLFKAMLVVSIMKVSSGFNSSYIAEESISVSSCY